MNKEIWTPTSLREIAQEIKEKAIEAKTSGKKKESEEIDASLEFLAAVEKVLSADDLNPATWELWLTELSDSLGKELPAETAKSLQELKKKFTEFQESEAEMQSVMAEVGNDPEVLASPEFKKAQEEYEKMREETRSSIQGLKGELRKYALSVVADLRKNKEAKKQMTVEEIQAWQDKFKEVKLPKDYKSYVEALKGQFMARKLAPVKLNYGVDSFGRETDKGDRRDEWGQKWRTEVQSLYERKPVVKEFVWSEFYDFALGELEKKYPGKKGEEKKKLVLDIFFGKGKMVVEEHREQGYIRFNSKLEEEMDTDLARRLLEKHAETRALAQMGPRVWNNSEAFDYCIDLKIALAGWPSAKKEAYLVIVPYNVRQENSANYTSTEEGRREFYERQKAYEKKREEMQASDPEFLNRIDAVLRFQVSGKEKEMGSYSNGEMNYYLPSGEKRDIDAAAWLSPLRKHPGYKTDPLLLRGGLGVNATREGVLYSKEEKKPGVKTLTREEAEEQTRIFMQGLSDIQNRNKAREGQTVVTAGDFVRIANERVAAAQEVVLSAKREVAQLEEAIKKAGGLAEGQTREIEELKKQVAKQQEDAKSSSNWANETSKRMSKLENTGRDLAVEVERLHGELSDAQQREKKYGAALVLREKKIEDAMAELKTASFGNRAEVIAAVQEILERRG